jgi:hypothetical protein
MGTGQSSGTIANGYTWWKVRWDNGAIGWTASAFLQTLQDNEPNLDSVSIVTSAKVLDRVCLDGDAKDDWNLNTVGMKVNGSTFYEYSVSGTLWPMSGYCFTPSSAGTYTVEAYATDIKWITTKTLYVNVTSPTPPDSPPSFSGVTTSYNIKSPGSSYLSGTITDDKRISSVQVYSAKSGSAERLIYQRIPNSLSYSLGNFSFTTSDPTYYSGPGTYSIRVMATDSVNQSATQYLSVIVTQDNSVRINELKSLINENNQKKASKTTAIASLRNQNTILNNAITNNITTYTQYETELGKIPDPSPSAPSTNTSLVSIPDGCVPIASGKLFETPLRAGVDYKTSFKCKESSKGTLYFISEYKKYYDSDSCSPSKFNGIYPAAMVYFPLDGAPYIQKVKNNDQATFWAAFYSEALSNNLETSVSKYKNIIGYHPSSQQLSAALTEYTSLKEEIYDVLTDELASELKSEPTTEEINSFTDPIFKRLGKFPYIEVKNNAQSCGTNSIAFEFDLNSIPGHAFIVPSNEYQQQIAWSYNQGTASASLDAPKALPALGAAVSLGARIISAGKAGQKLEKAVVVLTGVAKNTKTVVVNGVNRIPDFYIKGKLIFESKNVLYLSYTKQLKDYVEIARREGTKLTIYVAKGKTQISSTLKAMKDRGEIIIEYIDQLY